MYFDTSGGAAAVQLSVAARELGRVSEGLLEAAATARSLSAATDWCARAAEAFHQQADEWAREVSALYDLADAARRTAERARDSAWVYRSGGL